MSDKYAIGYGRPPKHSRFKPGQSGNKKGRPKGTKNLRTDLFEELSEKITVTEGGQQFTVSKQRALIKSMMAKGMKGDTTAARALFNLMVGLEQVDGQDRQPDEISSNDLEILAAYRQRILDTESGEGDSE